MQDYSYIGSGKISMQEVGATTGLIEVGNASVCAMAVAETIKEMKDYTAPGGGTYNEVRRIDSVEFKCTLHDMDGTNLAKVLFGDVSSVAGATLGSPENVTAKLGAIVEFAHPGASAALVQDVTNTTTYVLGTDYEITPAGIKCLTGGSITQDEVLHVTYTYPAYDIVEALRNSAKEYEILFEGLNEARSGKEVIVKLHRVKIGAAQNIDLISEDYAALEVSGKVLKDITKTGSLSQYFQAKIVA
jgi:hypothetical protein